MKRLSSRIMQSWLSLGPSYLPFADVATPDLPLSRLLRLSLFQVSVGMALVLLVGTLNRVMIVELDVPASIVGIMLALPLVIAPFRAFIGFQSDNHKCALGWRRVPFIWSGTLYQFGGFAFMPMALLVLAGKGESGNLPLWVGQCSAALSFLLVGAGIHIVQTTGLALATDLTPQESHPKVVGLMYVMLLFGMIVSSLAFGAALQDFSSGRLIQVIQSAALLTMILNGLAMWKQETRNPANSDLVPGPDPSFQESWQNFCAGEDAVRRLAIVGLGTMAFGMADVLLEPFGGHVLGLTVSATTRLTALVALGGLVGFAYAARACGKGGNPYSIARAGAFIGIPAFLFVMSAAPVGFPVLFLLGNLLIGLGGALFAHGTLTATMNRAPSDQIGLALGSWGAVQATAVGIGMALSGIIRDVVNSLQTIDVSQGGTEGMVTGYLAVYSIEIGLLIITIVVSLPLLQRRREQNQVKGTELYS
ncbi:MAG: PucC family protein [Gammaproteobacteria bacterium]|nr:PucC family protein [Gammaproteobacteria bacterium]